MLDVFLNQLQVLRLGNFNEDHRLQRPNVGGGIFELADVIQTFFDGVVIGLDAGI